MFPFICADTEDNSKELLAAGKSGFDKELTQVAAITAEGKKWYASGPTSGQHFLKWFLRQPEHICYFHNTQYDLGALFGDTLDRLDVTLVGGRLIKAIWPQPSGIPKIFLDSFNIWPMSVKKLAPAFGFEKLEFDAKSKAYVFRDVEIIRAAMLFAWNLAQTAGLEKCPNTLGGFCVSLWQEWGGSNVHDSSLISRAALFGGRVELFKVESETSRVCYTDINSLYPFVMQREFPGPLESYGRKLPQHGVADITIKVPKCDIAPLPVRCDDGRILYPFGTFRGTWTMPEILNACEHGAKIQKVHDAIGSDETMTPYRDFVSRLYQARLSSGSDAEYLMLKLLMNNLYGRLGTTGAISRSVWQTPKNRDNGVPYGDKVLIKYQLPLSEETNWCHAAYVTAYGRLELQKYLRLVGTDRLIYCDTDSVIFDTFSETGSVSEPSCPFDVGKELGQMKLEGWFPYAHTWAPKTYTVGRGQKADWKAKGVPKRLAQTFIQQGRASYDMPFRMREAIAFYDGRGQEGFGKPSRLPNTRKLGVWRTVEKVMRTQYDKKKLKGNRFYPCNFSNI